MGYQPIENYGVIGDLHTVALVGMDGSIDFMCAPRFDDERGGHFRLAPLLKDALTDVYSLCREPLYALHETGSESVLQSGHVRQTEVFQHARDPGGQEGEHAL